jgi:hypothetical protein
MYGELLADHVVFEEIVPDTFVGPLADTSLGAVATVTEANNSADANTARNNRRRERSSWIAEKLPLGAANTERCTDAGERIVCVRSSCARCDPK